MQYRNMTMCLGKPGDRDEWLVAVPESTMRLFDNGVEVTRQLARDFEYFPAGFILPNANSEGQRYPEYGGQVRYNAAGEDVPTQDVGFGCRIRRATSLPSSSSSRRRRS
jgi:hypothetical protein